MVASQTTWTESSSTPMRPNGSAPWSKGSAKLLSALWVVDFPFHGDGRVHQRTGDFGAGERRALHLATDPMARLSTGYSV